MPPVCSNCGAGDFVWANELKTGTIGGGTLSLRSRGELSMGTRICRGCGHADLFLKDPAILRMPHVWRPGEFVPIPSSPGHHSPHGSEPKPPESPAAPTPPPVAAPTPPPPPVEPMLPPPPSPPMVVETPPPPSETPASPDSGTRKSTRRRSKSKGTETPSETSAPPP
ncbi:MAG: hypothetical protein WA719_01855 [Thermoplasmata archaeon]